MFIANTFPEDPVHLEALSDLCDLTVYGTTFKLTTFTPPPGARTPRGIPTKVGEHLAVPPPGCATRVFTPLLRIRRGSIFWIYPRLGQALTADAPDVVHVVSEPWGALALQASVWCYLHPETALVVHGTDRLGWHGLLPERLAKRAISRFVLGRADGYAGESWGAVDVAWRAGLRRERPTAAIHGNPRDPAIFRPPHDESEKREARESLGLPQDGIGIGFLGRLSNHKGPLDFLTAVRDVANGGTWAAIAGIGSLQDEVKHRTAGTNVIYLGGLRFPDQVVAFYRSIDVLVVPSKAVGRWDEQGPRSIIEAMLASCIVVGTDCGSIPDMLGDCGVVVRQNDPEDLARGIEQAIARANDVDLRERSRERASAEYSGTAVATRLVRVWGEATQTESRVQAIARD